MLIKEEYQPVLEVLSQSSPKDFSNYFDYVDSVVKLRKLSYLVSSCLCFPRYPTEKLVYYSRPVETPVMGKGSQIDHGIDDEWLWRRKIHLHSTTVRSLDLVKIILPPKSW